MRIIKKKRLIQGLIIFVIVCCLLQVMSFYKLNFPSKKPISWSENGKIITTNHYYIAYETDVYLVRMELFLFLFCFGLVCVVIYQEYRNLEEHINELNKEKKK